MKLSRPEGEYQESNRGASGFGTSASRGPQDKDDVRTIRQNKDISNYQYIQSPKPYSCWFILLSVLTEE